MQFQAFNRPGWIFFDLDDTLWDFAANSLRSLEYIYANTPLIRNIFSSLHEFIEEYHVHNSKLWEEFAKGEVTSAFLKTERWRRTLFPDDTFGKTHEECTKINDSYLSKLASFPYTVNGAIDVLEKLAKTNMIGIISNGFTDTQYRKLYNSGLWKYITRMIISDETDVQKPDIQIFEYAVSETGASGLPVMIGDNPHTDILGALHAGWKALWFNPAGKEFPYSGDELAAKGIDPSNFLGSAKDMKKVELLLSQCDSING